MAAQSSMSLAVAKKKKNESSVDTQSDEAVK